MLTTWVSKGGTHHDDDGNTQAFIALTWVIITKLLSQGESLDVVQKVSLFFQYARSYSWALYLRHKLDTSTRQQTIYQEKRVEGAK